MSMTGENASNMRVVNQAVPKVDSEALVTGKANYTKNIAHSD